MTASRVAPWHEQDAFWETFAPSMFGERRRAIAPDEVERVIALAGVEVGATILDMPCGIGRHAVEFARRGFRVTGVDRTRSYLEAARAAATEAGVELDLLEGDMREFERTAAFDLAINMFTSFGYFEDPADDLRVAQRFARSLRRGGVLVMDLVGKEVLAREFEARGWSEIDGTLVLDQRDLSQDWGWIRNRSIVIRDAERREVVFEHRLYSAAELRALLLEASFASVEAFGNLEGAPYDQDALRLVVVARTAA